MSENRSRTGNTTRPAANNPYPANRAQGQRPASGQRPAGYYPQGQRPQSQRPQGQRPAQPGQRRPQPQKRKKKSNAGFIVLLVVIAVLAVAAGVLVAMKPWQSNGGDPVSSNQPAAVNTQPTEQPQLEGVLDPNALGAEETDAPDAPVLSQNQMVTVTDLSINPNLPEEWLNVLLLGSDQREPTEPFRTDSMIICSINKTTGEVKLSSLMRDTAVYFDDLGEYSGLYRLNLANYFGGPEYVMKTLNELLKMNLQYYAMVDFNSFATIADALGGIDIAVSKSEMEEINFNLHRQARVAYASGMSEEEIYATHVYLEEYGENVHLNGPQALGYARIRKLDSDSARTERQRKVLVALLEKLSSKSPAEVMQIGINLLGYVTTNMSSDDIISVALTVVSSDFTEIEQLRLPVNGTYVLETRDGESMLYDTNWDSNATALYEFIYGK